MVRCRGFFPPCSDLIESVEPRNCIRIRFYIAFRSCSKSNLRHIRLSFSPQLFDNRRVAKHKTRYCRATTSDQRPCVLREKYQRINEYAGNREGRSFRIKNFDIWKPWMGWRRSRKFFDSLLQTIFISRDIRHFWKIGLRWIEVFSFPVSRVDVFNNQDEWFKRYHRTMKEENGSRLRINEHYPS